MTFMKTALRSVAAAAMLAGMSVAAHAQEVTLKLHQFLPAQANVPKLVLDVWADKVEADWVLDARQQRAEELADEIAQKVRDGAALPYLAASRQVDLANTPAVTRAGDALPEGYPRSLASALFEIEDIGGVTVVSGPDAVYVAQLSEIETPDGEGGDAIREQITAELERSQRADVIELLLADLEERHEVETDRESVVSVFAISDQQQ